MKKSKDNLFALLVLLCLTILGITAPANDFQLYKDSLLAKSYAELNKSATEDLKKDIQFNQNMSSTEESNPAEAPLANFSSIVRDSAIVEPAE